MFGHASLSALSVFFTCVQFVAHCNSPGLLPPHASSIFYSFQNAHGYSAALCSCFSCWMLNLVIQCFDALFLFSFCLVWCHLQTAVQVLLPLSPVGAMHIWCCCWWWLFQRPSIRKQPWATFFAELYMSLSECPILMCWRVEPVCRSSASRHWSGTICAQGSTSYTCSKLIWMLFVI